MFEVYKIQPLSTEHIDIVNIFTLKGYKVIRICFYSFFNFRIQVTLNCGKIDSIKGVRFESYIFTPPLILHCFDFLR